MPGAETFNISHIYSSGSCYMHTVAPKTLILTYVLLCPAPSCIVGSTITASEGDESGIPGTGRGSQPRPSSESGRKMSNARRKLEGVHPAPVLINDLEHVRACSPCTCCSRFYLEKLFVMIPIFLFTSLLFSLLHFSAEFKWYTMHAILGTSCIAVDTFILSTCFYHLYR